MLYNENGNTSFNSFEYLDEFPYRVFKYLAENKSKQAENFWKCLKYNDIYCLKKPNLTFDEKMDLIWTGQSNTENYRIFNTPLTTDSMNTSAEMTQIRFFEATLTPESPINATVLYEIDIYTNDKTNSLYNDNDIWVEKTSFIQNSCLLPLLNGLDLGIGYNYLRFDKMTSRGSQSIIGLSNSKSFYGRSLFLALKYSNADRGGC